MGYYNTNAQIDAAIALVLALVLLSLIHACTSSFFFFWHSLIFARCVHSSRMRCLRAPGTTPPVARRTSSQVHARCALSSTASASSCEADWRRAVGAFWRPFSERDAAALVAAAESQPHLRDVQSLSTTVLLLQALLPDACPAAMVLRAPQLLLSFQPREASRRVLELRALCPRCDVTRVLECHPALLTSPAALPELADGAARHLAAVAGGRVGYQAAMALVLESPEIFLLRVEQYQDYDALPVEIQNALTPPWDEWDSATERAEAYAQEWGEAEP